MYIITLILGIIGVVLLAFAIREDEDDRAFPLGILSVVSLICSGAILTPSMNENNNFNFC